MKKLLLILTIISFVSCKQKENKDETVSEKTNTEFKVLEKNFMNWWTYHENNISLASNFTSLDEQSEKISKNQFLKTLTSGDYIPIKLDTKDDQNNYKLFKLSASANKSIRNTIKNTSTISYMHYKLEGTSFPEFEFTDMLGTHYTKSSTKGKTIILKCWFINCKPCIKEFPELNELVERNLHRDDILFVSLALDSKLDLEGFLINKQFKYQIIPEQEKFIETKLNVKLFPTHFVINGKGLIAKVVNKSTDLISYLENKKIIIEKRNESIMPPPPPM